MIAITKRKMAINWPVERGGKAMESPFYEKAGRYLHAGISENMTFPVHLQEEMEIIYCLEGSLQATVMNQVREVE